MADGRKMLYLRKALANIRKIWRGDANWPSEVYW